jgi:phosphoribosyl 1,2-cyclic phosphate phosphodiesterase
MTLANNTKTKLRFLGTGTSTGMPSFFCDCPACREAAADPRWSRGCSSVLLQSNYSEGIGEGEEQPLRILIDTAPELRQQLLDAGLHDIDAVLYTHSHHDHVAGLGALEFYVRLRRKQPLPVYALPAVLDYLASHFDFMADCLELIPIKYYEPCTLGNLRFTALPASHGPDVAGYLIERSAQTSTRLAYFPDTARLAAEVQALVQGADVVIFDATFNGSNWMPDVHMDIDSTIAYLLELDCARGYLTHLSMSYDTPITAAQLAEKLSSYQGRIIAAFDGLEIAL